MTAPNHSQVFFELNEGQPNIQKGNAVELLNTELHDLANLDPFQDTEIKCTDGTRPRLTFECVGCEWKFVIGKLAQLRQQQLGDTGKAWKFKITDGGTYGVWDKDGGAFNTNDWPTVCPAQAKQKGWVPNEFKAKFAHYTVLY
eukprot:919316_1